MRQDSGRRRSLEALSNRDYRWYWFSGLGMTGAQGIQQLTLAWLVLDLTGSTGQLGLVIFMMGMPMAIIALFGGVIADRYDRKLILQLSQGFTSANLLLLSVLTWTEVIAVWHLYLAAVGLGVMQAVTMPARNAMIQTLVPPDQRQNAVALNVAQMHTSRIVWPSLAGVMIATAGVGATLAVSAAGSLIGIVFLSVVPSSPVTSQQRRSALAEIVEGVRYTFSDPLVGRAATLALCVATFGLAFLQLGPGFARQELNFGASTTGLFIMASGIGAVVGSTALVLFAHTAASLGRLALFCGGFGVSLFLLGVNPSTAVAFLIVGSFGFFNSGILITAQSIFQVRVPEHLLGRAMSLFGIVGGLGSVSALPIGAIGDELGLRYPIGFVGLMLLGLTLLLMAGAQPLRWLGRPADYAKDSAAANALAGAGEGATGSAGRPVE